MVTSSLVKSNPFRARAPASSSSSDLIRGYRFPVPAGIEPKFKLLEGDVAHCITFPKNELKKYVSAFANSRGGELYYGVTSEGVIRGVIISMHEIEEIRKRVAKEISSLIWPRHVGSIQQFWEITFRHVKDTKAASVKYKHSFYPNLYVITIIVYPCQGGVFVEDPLSFHVVENEVRNLTFSNWFARMQNLSTEEVDRTVTCVKLEATGNASGRCYTQMSLKRLDWVENVNFVDVNERWNKRQLEIVYKYSKKPRTEEIVDFVGQESPPFVVFREGSKDEWFEKNILDMNYDMKQVYVNKLKSERFEWIEDFKIVDTPEERYKHSLEVICKLGKVPCTADIEQLFGEDILPFVSYKESTDSRKSFEKIIFDGNNIVKETYKKKLEGLEWVKSFQLAGESDDRHLEIVYKFGNAPQVPDIVNIFPENILPFVRYREESKDEWFEENVLDENYDMKEIYVHELISERFPWVKDFYISVTSDPESSWQIFITYARNTMPSMKDLKKLFGVKIASFVDFIPESDASDKKPLTSSCFLRAPSSGDSLYVQNEERGTIGILATRISDTHDHYAVTCYHVCYCQSELPEFIHDAHDTLKEDCGSNASLGCFATKCHYINKDTELGNFGCGLYDDKNDIALIELAPGLTCNEATTLLKDGVESKLLGKKEVGEIYKEYKKKGEDIFPKVKKIGSVTKETEGILYAISGAPKSNGMNNGFYRIRGTGENDFAEKGDSGSLVYIVDKGKNFPFAIVSNKDPDDDVYYCPNLLQSIEALGKEYHSIRIQPCLNQCGRTNP
ncbi:uncharacterized protein LOC114525883 [Dendronephthya gigantea]|uniref:uncharacterized protein LOC114525883 n=1 Tax=Dendronephthya gigantea TaxID=151771 RepID=UPI00106A06F3|nr:uncharacterized protein LOC114525883 [Dendronephthya gigantea]